MALAQPSGGLEELVDVNSGRELVATPVLVDKYADLKKKYELFLGLGGFVEGKWEKNRVQTVLLPSHINVFLQQTREYENHKNYGWNTGHFISQLIQNSYNTGNNDFELDVNLLKPIDYLASNISGTKERMVRIIVKGDVGNLCGYNVQYSTFTIKKAGEGCGLGTQHSTFTIGEAGNNCGGGVQYSTFTIEKAGNNCGVVAEHSTFTIEEAGDYFGRFTKHSTFQTHSSQQYKQLKKSVPRFKNNKVYHIQPDGTLKKRWF